MIAPRRSCALSPWLGQVAEEEQGITLAAVGDVDADGFADLLVGCYRGISGYSAAGAALLRGPMAGTHLLGYVDAVGDFGWHSSGYNDAFVAGLGDVDGDRFDDFAVGSRGDDSAGVWAGSLAFLRGGAF